MGLDSLEGGGKGRTVNLRTPSGLDCAGNDFLGNLARSVDLIFVRHREETFSLDKVVHVGLEMLFVLRGRHLLFFAGSAVAGSRAILRRFLDDLCEDLLIVRSGVLVAMEVLADSPLVVAARRGARHESGNELVHTHVDVDVLTMRPSESRVEQKKADDGLALANRILDTGDNDLLRIVPGTTSSTAMVPSGVRRRSLTAAPALSEPIVIALGMKQTKASSHD